MVQCKKKEKHVMKKMPGRKCDAVDGEVFHMKDPHNALESTRPKRSRRCAKAGNILSQKYVGGEALEEAYPGIFESDLPTKPVVKRQPTEPKAKGKQQQQTSKECQLD